MEIQRLFDIPQYQLKNKPLSDALVAKESGQWKHYATQEVVSKSNDISKALLAIGIQKGDKVAVIANNRPEWNIVDIGMLQIGVINVPLYPTSSEADFKFIFNDAEVKLAFVSDKTLFDKVSSIKKEVSTLKEIYTFDKVEGATHWTELLQSANQKDEKDIKSVSNTIKYEDLATIIYTSGTTGNPKGVMLSHKNILSNVLAVRNTPPLTELPTNAKALSFLPLNHIYERMLTYVYMYLGIAVYYAESIDKIADNLKEVKPHIFTTVPRLLEKVYDKIVAKGNEQKGIKKTLFFWALNLGLRYEIEGENGWWYELQLKIANALVFKKWREGLGGNVQAIVSGGAALQERLARVFNAGKIPVYQGYGLTETSPVIATNTSAPGGFWFGTVGPVIPGVEVKIAEDGEILCKGPNVMMGYYKRPDLTAEVIDKDGWFHTGDIGEFVNNKYLKITDRKKEIFKTSGGKYIAPLAIENLLKESPYIEQVMVVGDGRKYAAALIVPAFAYIKDWYQKEGKEYISDEATTKDQAIIKKITEHIEKTNKTLAQYETIKRFELIPKEWTIDGGEMTPKLSLKRKVILEKYKDLFEKLYVN